MNNDVTGEFQKVDHLGHLHRIYHFKAVPNRILERDFVVVVVLAELESKVSVVRVI